MIGLRIKELRRSMGISQRELALLIGKPSHVVCKIEKGKRRVTGDEVWLFAVALGVSASRLLGEDKVTENER